MSEYQLRLREIERNNELSITWKQVVVWGCVGASLLLVGLVSVVLFFYHTELTPITIGLLITTAVILLFLILAVWGATLSQISLLRRDTALIELRFDVHAAVESSLHHVLSRHLPNYTRLHTELDVGEELVRRATYVSRRHAELARKIQSIYAEKSLAEAIDIMVRDSLLARGQIADNAAVAKFLDQVDTIPDTNIVPLRTPINE